MEIHINILTQVLAGLILAGIIGTASFLSILYRCSKKQDARSIRQSRGLLLLTNFVTHEKKVLHPEAIFRDIEKEIKSTLTDEKGNY